MEKKFALKRQSIDSRDFKYTAVTKANGTTNVNNVPYSLKMPPVLDQGNIGSCALNAVANAYRYLLSSTPTFMPSRLYMYFNTRIAFEGEDAQTDNGVQLRNVFRCLNTYSVCNESVWPYIVSQYTTMPSLASYQNASSYKRQITYRSIVQDLTTLKATLLNKYPIVFGVDVYESFMSDSVSKTGVIPMPNVLTEQLVGGHALLLCGFNDSKQVFIGQNSWSTNWGQHGYFEIPYAYVLDQNLAFDFWIKTL